MKIAITGGHLSPALAVIRKLPKETKVIFFGRKHALEGDRAISLEYKIVQEMGIPFYAISTGRLQRKLTRRTFSSLVKIPVGLMQAFAILQKEKPDVVMAFGGYLAFPVALAAYLLRIPVIIHEQTLDAGLTNKIVGKFATKVCISWETSRKYFPPKKTILTGNPIRKEIEEPGYESSLLSTVSADETLLYITGGSLGSHAINTLVEGCLEKLLEEFVIIHQTGDAKEFGDFERLKEGRLRFTQEMQRRYILTKFVNPMEVGSIMKRAGGVIARSGINTVSELLFLKKPALLIPLPYAQAREQQRNAELLEELDLARVVKQDTLTSEKLYTEISELMQKKDHVKDSELRNVSEILKNAAENIVHVIDDVLSKK